MGGNMSRVVGCFVPHDHHDKVAVFLSEPLDEGLGHSFCYLRPVSASSPTHSDAEAEPPNNGVLRHHNAGNGCCSHESHRQKNLSEASFKAISGASVSANTSTPRTITSREQFSSFANVSYDRAAAFEATASFSSLPLQPVPRGLSQSGPITGSLSGQPSGPLDRGFLSGPIERGFMSGPLERGCVSAPMEATDRSLFSAPLTGSYYAAYFRRRTRSLAQLVRNLGYPVKKALSRSLSKTTSSLARTQRSLTAPVKLLLGHTKDTARDGANQYDCPLDSGYNSSSSDSGETHNLQWAQGKAGEDRVHVVLSEEHGWLFVGIYDGFNGPDAPDFLMSNLYQEVYKELRGLLWDRKETPVRKEGEVTLGTSKEGKNSEERFQGPQNTCSFDSGCSFPAETLSDEDHSRSNYDSKCVQLDGCSHPVQDGCTCCTHAGSRDFSCEKLGHSNSDILETIHQWPSSGDEPSTQGELCDLSSCQRYLADGSSKKIESAGLTTQCHDYEAIMMKDVEEPNFHLHGKNPVPGKHRKIWSGRSLLEFKVRKAHCERKEQNRRLSLELEQDSKGRGKNFEENHKLDTGKLCKSGNADQSAVLKALASALASTERAYLQMADRSIEEMPELALMGSCVLVMLMKGQDVYVMNVGDSRAILAQVKNDSKAYTLNSRAQVHDSEKIGARDSQLRQELERIMEETPTELETVESSHTCSSTEPPPMSLLLSALQLSADHSTNVEEEVLRIKAEHPDDKKSISNERVKGILKVTRAFGAGFLKMPRWNNSLLEMFRVNYVGTAPYVTCIPALYHHSLGPNDRFLVLSSDGLYQYLSNEEVVSQVEWFMENYPDGDPAQYLIEELLFRAAKKAGMEFHELLDIPQGDRRKYHDDVSVMVISLEGRIWRSFG